MKNNNIVRRLFSYLRPYRAGVAGCLLLVLAITGLELYRPIIIGDAIDLFINEDTVASGSAAANFQGILRAGMLYLAVLILLFVCNMAQYWFMQKIGQGVIYTMRQQIFSHIQSLSMRFFDITPVASW